MFCSQSTHKLLTAQLYMIMYILMFAAVIRLRYSQPDKARPYRIPGESPVYGSSRASRF